jgi:hypothetical protein
MPRVESPFAFWEGFTDYLAADPRPLQKLSQPDAYRALLTYAEQLNGVDATTLRRLLGVDFTTHEHKNPPYFMRVN